METPESFAAELMILISKEHYEEASALLLISVVPPVGGSARNAAKAQETRQHFSENKERSIALLRKAISTLEEEIADAEPVVVAVQKPKATPVIELSWAIRAWMSAFLPAPLTITASSLIGFAGFNE